MGEVTGIEWGEKPAGEHRGGDGGKKGWKILMILSENLAPANPPEGKDRNFLISTFYQSTKCLRTRLQTFDV